MSSIRERITQGMKEALRNKEELRLSVLRMTSSALHNREIEKRSKGAFPELSEEEVAAVLRGEIKKRRDASEGFIKGGRMNSAEKEQEEAGIIQSYLPPECSDAEVERAVHAAIGVTGASSGKDFGKVMGEAMKQLKGQASGDRVSMAVKKFLIK